MNFCYSVVCWDLGDTHTEVPQLVLHTKPEGEAENPRLPSPQPPLPPHPGEHRVIPKPAESYNLVSESWSVLGSPSGKTCPKHHNQRHLWGILVRRPDHLNCLLCKEVALLGDSSKWLNSSPQRAQPPFEGNVYLESYCFGHYTELVTIGEGSKGDCRLSHQLRFTLCSVIKDAPISWSLLQSFINKTLEAGGPHLMKPTPG